VTEIGQKNRTFIRAQLLMKGMIRNVWLIMQKDQERSRGGVGGMSEGRDLGARGRHTAYVKREGPHLSRGIQNVRGEERTLKKEKK